MKTIKTTWIILSTQNTENRQLIKKLSIHK